MDIKRVKQLAGLEPIVEAWDDGDFDRFMNGDDEDDLSDAERELVGQAERDLAAKGVKVKNVDPEADISALARTRAPEAEDDVAPAPAPEVDDLPRGPAPGEEPELGDEPEAAAPSAAEEFPHADEVDTPAEVQQAAKQAASRSGVTQLASRLLTTNPAATRAQFLAITRPLGISDASANTVFYSIRNKLRASTAAPSVLAPEAPAAMEFWVIKNAAGKVLSESGSYDLPLWADYLDTRFDARIFDKEVHAKKAVETLARYGFTKVEIAKESVDEGKVLNCRPDDGGYIVTVEFQGVPVEVWVIFDSGGSLGGHKFLSNKIYSLPDEVQNDILNAALGADFDECDARHGNV